MHLATATMVHVVLCCFLIADKLNYADSVINKVTLMQKQKDADTYVHGLVSARLPGW